jgi:hypothetical protein
MPQIETIVSAEEKYKFTEGATNLIKPPTCKGLPVPQQCVIKPFNYTPCMLQGLTRADKRRLRMGCR